MFLLCHSRTHSCIAYTVSYTLAHTRNLITLIWLSLVQFTSPPSSASTLTHTHTRIPRAYLSTDSDTCTDVTVFIRIATRLHVAICYIILIVAPHIGHHLSTCANATLPISSVHCCCSFQYAARFSHVPGRSNSSLCSEGCDRLVAAWDQSCSCPHHGEASKVAKCLLAGFCGHKEIFDREWKGNGAYSCRTAMQVLPEASRQPEPSAKSPIRQVLGVRISEACRVCFMSVGPSQCLCWAR
jgi:hypothetical protein